MKKIFILTFFIIGSFAVEAQEITWYTDIHEAIAISNKKKKPLMMFFTGSNWCGWCMKLQKEVLMSAEFKKWSENVVLVEIDDPRPNTLSPELKQQNIELAQAFSVRGYPTVHFATAESKDGKVNFKGLGNTGYVTGGPTAWLEVANGIIKTQKM